MHVCACVTQEYTSAHFGGALLRRVTSPLVGCESLFGAFKFCCNSCLVVVLSVSDICFILGHVWCMGWYHCVQLMKQGSLYNVLHTKAPILILLAIGGCCDWTTVCCTAKNCKQFVHPGFLWCHCLFFFPCREGQQAERQGGQG